MSESPASREGGRIVREKQLIEAKRMAQDAGYELRHHAEGGPDEFEVIDCEHGSPVGVYWDTNSATWRIHEAEAGIFSTIEAALEEVAKRKNTIGDEGEKELNH